jgi:hypothetical protein
VPKGSWEPDLSSSLASPLAYGDLYRFEEDDDKEREEEMERLVLAKARQLAEDPDLNIAPSEATTVGSVSHWDRQSHSADSRPHDTSTVDLDLRHGRW